MAQKTIDFENDILRPIGSLKEDLADLKDNKITKFYTSNNGDTVLNDSDDGKIQDLMIYGKSEQKQYKGINLLNYSKETVTVSGITFTYDKESQTYKVNGTATKQANKSIFEPTENIYVGKKIVGCPSGGQENTYNIVISYLDSTGAWKNESYDTGNGHIIKDYPKLSISILVRNGVTANNLVFKPMIVEDTTKTYDDFEPYVGGKPSPNPEYPQEIKAVVNPVIKTHGKNLIDFRKAKGGKGDGVTFTVNADGSINMRGTATGAVGNVWFLGNYRVTEPKEEDVVITLKKGKTYYVTDCVLYSVEHGSAVGYGNVVKPINKEIKVTGIRNINLGVGTTYNETIHPMIVESEVQIDWQPYQETQATLPYELYAIPVDSGGNVTIDGQQYIADYVDVERGKLVRKTHVTKFTGAENWVYTDSDKESLKRFGAPIRVKGVPYLGLSNYVINANKVIINSENAFSFYGTWVDVRITKFTSLVEFKNFLSEINSSGKPMIVIYALVTPEEIDLTPEAIEAFKALSTYYPKTHINTESEQLEAYTMFNYPVSMEKGWEYVKQQIGDTRKYVYDMDLQSAEAYVNSEYAVALTELEV